jgi:hypothetical protein
LFCSGLLDHVDGTVDAHTRLHDAAWTHCRKLRAHHGSKPIRDMVYTCHATAFTAWNNVHGLFLNNVTQRAIYAQELHSLQ